MPHAPDRDRLKSEIAKYRWYQSIELAPGIVTPGETGEATQNKLDMMQLPDNLEGMSVLEIGCNEGFFIFEAERRGAAKAVAIDKGKAARDKFNFVKKTIGSAVEFHDLDLFDIDPQEWGRFDLVFFLAVLHHVEYPFLAIDRVSALTGGMAIFEFVEAVPDQHKEMSALVRQLSKKGHLHWLPTRRLTLELLKRAGFTQIQVLGTHRARRGKDYRGIPGFSLQRVLIKAVH